MTTVAVQGPVMVYPLFIYLFIYSFIHTLTKSDIFEFKLVPPVSPKLMTGEGTWMIGKNVQCIVTI
jgi:hypothetical protein